jgi:hypothetical protein
MLFSNISSMSLLFDTFLPGKEQRRVGVQAGGISIGDFRNSKHHLWQPQHAGMPFKARLEGSSHLPSI